MIEYYILNEDHSVSTTNDVVEWARRLEDTRHVAATDLDGVRVVTVFFGHDWGFEGTPRTFGTMIFGGPRDKEETLYSSYDEAVRGHESVVDSLR